MALTETNHRIERDSAAPPVLLTHGLADGAIAWPAHWVVRPLASNAPVKAIDAVVVDAGAPEAASMLRHAREMTPKAVRILIVASGDWSLDGDLAHIVTTTRCVVRQLRGSWGGPHLERARADIEAIVGPLADVPALQASCFELLEAIDHPDASLAHVVQLIERRPTLAARVLKVANSPLYGLPRTVSRLDYAARFLGLSNLRSMVVGLEVFNVFEPKLYSHILRVQNQGIVRVRIAREMGGGQHPDATAPLLLQGIGQLIMVQRVAEYQPFLYRTLGTHVTLADAEFDTFGITHLDVGAALLSHWGLPEVVSLPVLLSHTPYPRPSAGLDARCLNYLAAALTEESVDPVAPSVLPDGWLTAQNLHESTQAGRELALDLTLKVTAA